MILRKLLRDFFLHAHIETTEKRAKVLKVYVDRIVSKTKERTEANKNYLLRYFPQTRFVNVLFDQVGPAVKAITGGYVRTVRLHQRITDGAVMMRVEWAHPVVISWEPVTKASKASRAKALSEKTSEVKKPKAAPAKKSKLTEKESTK